MNIPKSFNILAHKILVKMDADLKASSGNLGEVNLNTHIITLQPSMPRYFITRSAQEQVFLHEMVHAILYTMGEEELGDNEKFVDMFAGLLHQCLETQKGIQ